MSLIGTEILIPKDLRVLVPRLIEEEGDGEGGGGGGGGDFGGDGGSGGDGPEGGDNGDDNGDGDYDGDDGDDDDEIDGEETAGLGSTIEDMWVNYLCSQYVKVTGHLPDGGCDVFRKDYVPPSSPPASAPNTPAPKPPGRVVST